MSGLVVLPGPRMLRKFIIIVLVHIMASLFFSCDVWRAAREVVPADNISTDSAVTLQDVATDFLCALHDHSEFRHLSDPASLLSRVEGRVKVSIACPASILMN